jgi:hypothetical protein
LVEADLDEVELQGRKRVSRSPSSALSEGRSKEKGKVRRLRTHASQLAPWALHVDLDCFLLESVQEMMTMMVGRKTKENSAAG